jgi:hypothetical protein
MLVAPTSVVGFNCTAPAASFCERRHRGLACCCVAVRAWMSVHDIPGQSLRSSLARSHGQIIQGMGQRQAARSDRGRNRACESARGAA